MSKHEDKALKNILQGREVEKKIQVGGYDKEFSEKMKQEREQERKHSEAISKIMECSNREATNAVITLDNDHLEEILYKAGYQSDQVVKMFK